MEPSDRAPLADTEAETLQERLEAVDAADAPDVAEALADDLAGRLAAQQPDGEDRS